MYNSVSIVAGTFLKCPKIHLKYKNIIKLHNGFYQKDLFRITTRNTVQHKCMSDVLRTAATNKKSKNSHISNISTNLII